ncbi:hypothetical protein DENSPDRAFT_836291 [Dentipellis sp. KUC8613]|nr:hypothetical protein DENSPDRAFT_836291 [Dentipellis sp. KUC8613]
MSRKDRSSRGRDEKEKGEGEEGGGRMGAKKSEVKVCDYEYECPHARPSVLPCMNEMHTSDECDPSPIMRVSRYPKHQHQHQRQSIPPPTTQAPSTQHQTGKCRGAPHTTTRTYPIPHDASLRSSAPIRLRRLS